MQVVIPSGARLLQYDWEGLQDQSQRNVTNESDIEHTS